MAKYKYSPSRDQFYSLDAKGVWQIVPKASVPPETRIAVSKKQIAARDYQGSIPGVPFQAPPLSAISAAYKKLPLVPHTAKQAAIDAAMIGGGLATEGMGWLPALALRLGLTSGAGALASKLSGGSALEGAKSGAIQQGVGEVAAPIMSLAGAYGPKTLNAMDSQRLGVFMRQLTNFDTPTTVEEFSHGFRGGGIKAAVGEKLGKMQAFISQELGDKPILQLPDEMSVKGGEMGTIFRPATFDQVVERIEKLNEQAKWERSASDPAVKMAGREARLQSRQLRDLLFKNLDKQHPGLGEYYAQKRRDYAGISALTDLFQTKDLYRPNGTFDWSKLHDLVVNVRDEGGYRDELNTIFGREKVDQLLRNINRGAPEHVEDVPGAGLKALPRLMLHPSGIGAYAHLPAGGVFSSRVGTVARRFPPISPAIPGIAAGQQAEDVLTGGQ